MAWPNLPRVAPSGNKYDRQGLRRKVEAGIDSAESFDATKALNTYAQGAWGSISDALGQQLQGLEDQQGGTGRFNSGLYDRDQGEIVKAGERAFANDLSSHALDAERLQLDQQNEGYDRAANLYALDESDYRDSEERKRRSKSGIGSALGGLLGAGAGFLAGGPGGIAPGAKLGSGFGGAVGSRF